MGGPSNEYKSTYPVCSLMQKQQDRALPQSNMASQHPPLVRRILTILQPWVPCTVESWCYLTLRSCKISNINKGSSIAVNAFRVIRGPCDCNDFAPLMAPNLPLTSPGLRQHSLMPTTHSSSECMLGTTSFVSVWRIANPFPYY